MCYILRKNTYAVHQDGHLLLPDDEPRALWRGAFRREILQPTTRYYYFLCKRRILGDFPCSCPSQRLMTVSKGTVMSTMTMLFDSCRTTKFGDRKSANSSPTPPTRCT